MRKMLLFAALAVAVVQLLATAAMSATGEANTTSAEQAKTVVISTRKLPKLGTVLVNSKGRTLYMFVPDKRKRVTCVKSCAVIWPPVKLPNGAKPTAAGKAKRSLLGSDADPAGGRVVTYNGWPLYTYITDTAPGQAKGQALNLNGGLWYVLAPSGKVIRTKL
jgi:predicted lipoprotein with Yx(FWY)xxD motif